MGFFLEIFGIFLEIFEIFGIFLKIFKIFEIFFEIFKIFIVEVTKIFSTYLPLGKNNILTLNFVHPRFHNIIVKADRLRILKIIERET